MANEDKFKKLEKRYEDVNVYRWVWFSISILLIGVIAYIGVRGIDNLDIDDQLGPYICEQHDMNYVDVKYNLYGGLSYLQIRCAETEEVSDGYVVKYIG